MSVIDESHLGVGPTAFRQMLESTGGEPENTYEVTWKGHLTQLPVFKISIKQPRYNLHNVRVKPHLTEYVSKNDLPGDYFTTEDKDSRSIQKIIHGFLCKNPDRKDALKFFRSGNKQTINEPLVCTPDGRVINGNQRLSVYRELFTQDPGKYRHLDHAYVAILPNLGTYEDERLLESDFQQTGLQAVFFDWIQIGLQDIADVEHYSAAGIGKRSGRTEAEVKESIRRIRLAKEFLEIIDKSEFWVELRDQMNLRQAFKTLDAELNKLKKKDSKQKLKKISFKFMQDPDGASKGKGTSVHLLIIKASKNLAELGIRNKPKAKVSGVDPLLNPIGGDVGGEDEDDDDGVDLDDIDANELANKVIDTDTIREGRRKAKNESDYGKRQLKTAITSFDTMLDNWDALDKSGMKKLVNQASLRLERIRDKI